MEATHLINEFDILSQSFTKPIKEVSRVFI